METALQLLMRDGAVQVHFRPRLTPEQYAEFVKVVDTAATLEELKAEGESAAKRWNVKFDCEKIGI